MNIIFDLDGTLIDSSERMYRLFCELIPQCKFSKEEYWDLKRDRINHKQLLETFYPEIDFWGFNRKWMLMIEEKRFLDMDSNYEDTIPVMKQLSCDNNIYLLTARQSKQALLDELKRLKLFDFFQEIFVTEGKMSKEELLKVATTNNVELLDKNSLFISDMGQDISIGNMFGYYTVAITHGFMSGKRLKEYKPQNIIDQLNEIFEI